MNDPKCETIVTKLQNCITRNWVMFLKKPPRITKYFTTSTAAHSVSTNLVISFHLFLYAFETMCVGVMTLKSIIRLQRVIRQALTKNGATHTVHQFLYHCKRNNLLITGYFMMPDLRLSHNCLWKLKQSEIWSRRLYFDCLDLSNSETLENIC